MPIYDTSADIFCYQLSQCIKNIYSIAAHSKHFKYVKCIKIMRQYLVSIFSNLHALSPKI
jgi:hypothetical protein